MAEKGLGVRLRQAVLAARELEPLAGALRAELGLQEPFRDPGVGLFGLHNCVFALGDCFLEIVSPTQADTAAGRYLDRQGGDGGYMVMFDLRDLAGARSRVSERGIRVVWKVDLPDIADDHLHPADMGGAIVALDQSEPYGSWRWGGPEWTGKVASGASARLAGVTLAVAEPEAVAERWAHVLGVPASDSAITLDGGEVCFTAPHGGGREGLVEIAVAVPAERRGGREAIELGGVRLRLLEDDQPAPGAS